jgi:diguanylate cyclase (GGDEF)-like protein
MVDEDSAGFGGQVRSRSLRREWSWAFTLMLTLVMATGVCTIVGLWHLVGQINQVVAQRDRETSVVGQLRTSLVSFEDSAHSFINHAPIDPVEYLHRQADEVALFERAIAIFPAGNGTRETLQKARRAWEKGLSDSSLWGNQVYSGHVWTPADNPTLGRAGDDTRAILDDLDPPSLLVLHQGLANGKTLERNMIILLAGLFALAAGVTAYFRRKMSRDLLRPVAAMREGVHRLRSGDLEHHIEVARNDELGELATAFNSMADSLHENHRALTKRATHDTLTGLANRAALHDHLTRAFDAASAKPTSCGSLLFVDVDDFKDVNDTLGHEAGDDLLVELVGRMSSCVGPEDLVSRLGGDEFAIVTAAGDRRYIGCEVAEKILESLARPFIINETSLTVSVSIGVAERRPEMLNPAELLRQADFAMYIAKGGGKSRYQVFDAEMHDVMVGRSALKADLANAVDGDQLRLDYQPIAELATGRIVGTEALVRWQHPKLGLLPPDDFIPLAEETGDIEAIGRWVLRAAVRQITEWRREIAACADLWVSVNLSAFQLPNSKSLAEIQLILTDPGVQAGAVVLEITETALVYEVDSATVSLEALRSTGARIAIDDFGTGFSSLSSLASLPVDILKIDRSFVSGHGARPRSVPILEGIIDLAHKLSLGLIAEGIEEPEQLDLLRRLGCPLGQGFLLARPASPEEVTALLASGDSESGYPLAATIARLSVSVPS